ncbi:hypothetical protein BVRB_4g084310 [Beta vulgaris subsp. vulgaris]|nr:hypothetical protein BVRB_4g084310 [Beta vulgaris subsp. vulgaris]
MPALTAESPVQETTSSAESNFRELDDAFLQTQARIWLGELLQIRFDEQTNISDLLADGELLFEVSEVIPRILPTLSVDETQLKVYERKSLPSNKSTRSYMPYYNVDSFLRMCKSLGMNGIDLFTPSDVVEKRNTRKVCMCLRSLSKKTRSKDLNVPDFDSVTCTLTMPTDMVECIRKNLERSQSSSSVSVEQEGENVSRVRFWRRMSNSASAVSNGYSDNCDEAESSFAVAESIGSSDYAYAAESPNISGSQVVGGDISALQLSIRDSKNEDDDQCEYLSPSNVESVGSPSSQYYSDEELNVPSSNCLGSRISGKVPELDMNTNHGYRISNVSHVPIDWGTSHLDSGNCKDGNANDDEVDHVTHDIEDEDTTCSRDFYPSGKDMCNEHLETLNNPSKLHRDKRLDLGEVPRFIHEDALSNSKEPFGCEVDPNIGKPYHHAKTNDVDLPIELLIQNSYVSKPSVYHDFSCNNENHGSKTFTEDTNGGGTSCCDELDNDNDISAKFVAESATSISLPPDRDTIIGADIPCCQIKHDKQAFDGNMVTPDHAEHSDNGFIGGNANNSLDMPHMDGNSSPYVVVAKNNTVCSVDCHGAAEGSEGNHDLGEDVNGKPINLNETILVNSCVTALCDPEPDAQSLENFEDTSDKNSQCVKEGEPGHVKREVTNNEIPLPKPQRKLLKSVVKGTALLGVAVFLVHLRKNRRETLSEAKKQQTHIMKQGAPKSLQKGQKGGSTSSVYPAEKLRLGI